MNDDDDSEQAYLAGKRMAWMELLAAALRSLDDGKEYTVVQMELQRQETIAAMRSICAEFGDNDWPDSLHPADVIEKHLARHLRERKW